MKLTIDIPEEIIEYIKNNGCLSVIYNDEVAKAIIDGTPVSTEGDLISREALKKACSEMVRGSNNSDFIPCPSWNNAMELIDNAPTVEELSYDMGYVMGYQDGLEDGLQDIRPQGEWIRLDLAKRVIAKFKGYIDEDMIERIQIALEKAVEQGGDYRSK